MKYKFKITEVYVYEDEIEANSKEEALKKVEEIYDLPPEQWVYGEDPEDWEGVFTADTCTLDSSEIEIME